MKFLLTTLLLGTLQSLELRSVVSGAHKSRLASRLDETNVARSASLSDSRPDRASTSLSRSNSYKHDRRNKDDARDRDSLFSLKAPPKSSLSLRSFRNLFRKARRDPKAEGESSSNIAEAIPHHASHGPRGYLAAVPDAVDIIHL